MFKESIMKTLLTNPLNSDIRKKYQSYNMPDLETEDYGGQKLSDHLQQPYKEKLGALPNFLLDHAYCKPLNWRLEKNPLIKPVSNLFIPEAHDERMCEEDIDVEGGMEGPKPWYDLAKAQLLMDECRKHISLVRADEGDVTWEQKVDRTGWSLAQTRLFDRTCKILNGDRLGRLAITSHHNEPMLRRILVNKTSRKFRGLMCAIYWDPKLTQWLHNTLLENLEMNYLVAYVEILQTLKSKIPELIERLLQGPTGSKTNVDALNVLVQRPWDPASLTSSLFNLRKLPGNPVLLFVPSTPGTKPRPSRWLPHLSQLGHVVSVNSNSIAYSSKVTLTNSLDQMVAATRMKLTDVRKEWPNRSIILVGVHSGAALACQVALLDVVSAVICLGFPVRTVEGARGLPDDTFLSITTPVIFVLGQQAASSSVDEMEELREQLPNCETGLIVVGAADDFLRVPKSVQHAEGVTQHVIDKCIIEEVGEFIGNIGKSVRNEESTGKVGSTLSQPRVKMLERRRKISIQESLPSQDTSLSDDTDKEVQSPANFIPRRGSYSVRKPRGPGRGRGRWGQRSVTSTSRIVPSQRGRYSQFEGRESVSPPPNSAILVSDVLHNTGGNNLATNDTSDKKTVFHFRVVGTETGNGSSLSLDSSSLVDQLTPDTLLEMPIIIAPDDASEGSASAASATQVPTKQPSSVKIVVRNRTGPKLKGGLKVIPSDRKPQVKCAKIILRKKENSSTSTSSSNIVTLDLSSDVANQKILGKEIKARICQLPQ